MSAGSRSGARADAQEPRRTASRSLRRRALLALSLTLCATALAAAGASAADPGRWVETGRSALPIDYFQGVTSDPARSFYFDGPFQGLWRTDARLRRTASNPAAIPQEVKTAEGYNHIGDLTHDGAEGGRLLLPVECYYPGQGGNTCRTGSIGVADPATLRWRYYVKLDPAFIAKAMWAEVSPDGELLWTSGGPELRDLLAYRVADITAANAAPDGPMLQPVRQLPGAVPPSGITGAVFIEGRLFVAGQATGPFQIWSIDPADGSRRLEIERRIAGESEGLDDLDALGGTLHWMIAPQDPGGRPPTYGYNRVAFLHYVPAGSPQARPVVRLRVSPGRARIRVRTRFRFEVRSAIGVTERPLAGAIVSFAGRRVRTDRRGRATLVVRLTRPGTYRAVATRRGHTSGVARVRAIR